MERCSLPMHGLQLLNVYVGIANIVWAFTNEQVCVLVLSRASVHLFTEYCFGDWFLGPVSTAMTCLPLECSILS